jgi:hypothetical protein
MDIFGADVLNCEVTGYELLDWDSFPGVARDICLHQLVPIGMVVHPDSERYLHAHHSFPWYFGEQTWIRLVTDSNLAGLQVILILDFSGFVCVSVDDSRKGASK